MKRIGFLAGAALALCSFAPARAQVASGTVMLPAAAPNPQRIAAGTGVAPNGTFGYVVEVGPGATNRPYALTLNSGATKLEDLDVFFYYSLDGMGDPCPDARDRVQSGKTETGTVCPNSANRKARYAIVVLKSGANARFTLTI